MGKQKVRSKSFFQIEVDDNSIDKVIGIASRVVKHPQQS